jgi:hypothetical protein
MSQETNTMNCDDYKLAIAAEPTYKGGSEHAAVCEQCTAYRSEMQTFDRRIAGALEIVIPQLTMPDLPLIDTDKIATLPTRRRMTTPTWIAIAASVLVAAFVGVQLTRVDVAQATLAEQLLAHMDHEPYAMRVRNKAVSSERLARVVPANVATMTHDAGLITYAQSCEINGHVVPHLVIQGKRGPITILLMPEEAIEAAEAIDGQSIHGFIIPVGSGSIAIIGEKEEQLDTVRESVLNSVRWST